MSMKWMSSNTMPEDVHSWMCQQMDWKTERRLTGITRRETWFKTSPGSIYAEVTGSNNWFRFFWNWSIDLCGNQLQLREHQHDLEKSKIFPPLDRSASASQSPVKMIPRLQFRKTFVKVNLRCAKADDKWNKLSSFLQKIYTVFTRRRDGKRLVFLKPHPPTQEKRKRHKKETESQWSDIWSHLSAVAIDGSVTVWDQGG